MPEAADTFLRDSERDYFYQFESLFNSPGWALMVKELTEEATDLPQRAFENAKSFEELQIARAKYRATQELLAYPQYIEQRKQHIIEERAQEATDKDGAFI